MTVSIFHPSVRLLASHYLFSANIELALCLDGTMMGDMTNNTEYAAIESAIRAAIAAGADKYADAGMTEDGEPDDRCWSHPAAADARRLTDEAGMTWEFTSWSETLSSLPEIARRAGMVGADDESGDFIRTYSIKNSNGLSGGDWNRQYNTREQAAAAIAKAYGWDAAAVAIGPKMIDEIGDDGEEEIAWCVYESQEDCDADDTGAHAPRIVRS